MNRFGPRTRLSEIEDRLADVSFAACDFPEPKVPIWITGVDTARARVHCGAHDDLGIMLQPGNSTHLRATEYSWVGMDNGCFSSVGFDEGRWLDWLEVLASNETIVGRTLFATAPDVVGDAVATLERSERPLVVIRKLGLPAALVAQDGLTVGSCPWDDFDALFIGGSTAWKMSSVAAELSMEARIRGKWVHYGRVNSWKRFSAVLAMHADSADGTFLAFGPEANWPRAASWLERSRTIAGLLPERRVLAADPTWIHPASRMDYGF